MDLFYRMEWPCHSVIFNTGPLSVDGTWGDHMEFTSNALKDLGEINGPRCCKRDAMI